MIPLLFAILASSAIALILKHNASGKSSTIQMLAANYFSASIIAFVQIQLRPESQFSFFTLIFAALMGILFTLSFFVFAKAVSAAGTPLATTASRLSVLIPFLISVLIYHESPGLLQTGGFLLSLLTIYLFYLSLRNNKGKKLLLQDYLYLLAVLIGIGIGESALKIFQESRPRTEEPWLLFFIFFSAFIYAAAIALLRRKPPDRRAIINGLVLGLPNIFSTYFLLGALAALPAVIVYPFNNIGIILFTAIAAKLLWQEKLDRYGLCALASGALSLMLLGT